MKTRRRLPRTWYTAWLGSVAIVPLLLSATALAVPPGEIQFDVPRDPSVVVVSLIEKIGEIETDDHAWLRIYADGRIERHVPSYMKQAGDYTGVVSPDRLRMLIRALAGRGVLDFDHSSVRHRKRALEKERSHMSAASDLSTIEIEVRLENYLQSGSLDNAKDIQVIAAWTGLRNDARMHPGLEPLQGLMGAFTELTEIAERVVGDGTRSVEARRQP